MTYENGMIILNHLWKTCTELFTELLPCPRGTQQSICDSSFYFSLFKTIGIEFDIVFLLGSAWSFD